MTLRSRNEPRRDFVRLRQEAPGTSRVGVPPLSSRRRERAVSARIQIAIADDHRLFREGLKALLKGRREVVVVAEAGRADDVDAMCAGARVDALLLDLHMDRNTLADIQVLGARVPVIALCSGENPDEGIAAVRRGARAVVYKDCAIDTLVEAIRVVAGGQIWLPVDLRRHLAAMVEQPSRALTAREREVVRHVARGLRNAEIARSLLIGEETVKTHLTNVFRKLALRDRVELTIYALRVGLVGSDGEPAATT